MNSLNEIAFQNQQDFWSMLYMYLGKSIKDILGRKGVEDLRKAMRTIAINKGISIRKEFLENGIKTNLETLYEQNVYCCADPRFRLNVLAHDEDFRLFEIYTCPLANLWLDNDASWLAEIYCEEYHLGLIKGFTEGIGQCCLGKRISCHRTNGTRPDNHCRFSVYYRAANCNPQQRAESFGDTDHNPLPDRDTRSYLAEKCVALICELVNVLYQDFSDEGLRAVSAGLYDLAKPAAEMMKHYSSATLSPDIKAFVSENIPLDLEAASDPAWDGFKDSTAFNIYIASFVIPFERELGISDKD